MYFGTKNGGWENPSRHFLKKNERITNVFRIAGVQSTQQFGIRGVKVIERLRENVECEGRFHISWNTRILS